MNTCLTYQEILIYDELKHRYEERRKTKWIDTDYAIFEIEKEAETVIKKITPSVYMLSYGEYDAPSYTVKPYQGRFVILKETFYQSGIYNAEENHILSNWEVF